MPVAAGLVYDPPAMRIWVLVVVTAAALGASSPPPTRASAGMRGIPSGEHVGFRCVRDGPGAWRSVASK